MPGREQLPKTPHNIARWLNCAKVADMEVTIQVPDGLAERLSAEGDVSRQILEAFALESYRNNSLTLLEVSQLLGLERVETEDFLGKHHVSLADIDEADLDREVAALKSLISQKAR